MAASLIALLLLSPVLVQGIKSTGRVSAEARLASGGYKSTMPNKPVHTAPGIPLLHDQHFLIISSPIQAKVLYTQVENGISTSGQTFPLVTGGLKEPKGIAVDTTHGNLYIADAGAQKIYRYGLVVANGGLETNGVRTIVVENATVDSVACDLLGNLFYTAGSTNNINKLPYHTIKHMEERLFDSSVLEIVSAKKLAGEAAGAEAQKLKKTGSAMMSAPPKDLVEEDGKILSLYEAKINDFVMEPGAIQVDGPALYWTNKKNGTKAGTVVRGDVNPKPPVNGGNASKVEPFPATVLSLESESAYGMVKTHSSILWSTYEKDENSGVVYGQLLSGGTPVKFVQGLSTPKGLAFDGDMTAYVADDKTGIVHGFPVGRLMDDAPATKTVEVNGSYGLCMLKADMPGFQRSIVEYAGAYEGYGSAWKALFVALFTLMSLL